ncbi:MAG: 30S ribosomal protein S9 [Candidatus Omnitrophica bacterium]|nr:30S ribosomal protein S9 [Candidatus Omnitrophota bacterium]
MVETAAKTDFWATGRRKNAIARVKLTAGKGSFVVNGESLEKYFPRETDRILIKQPLEVTNMSTNIDILANLVGGGKTGQAGALRLGISRALSFFNEANRPALKKEGLLRRDPRMKERKKYGQKGARKRFQWTKR